MVFAILAEMFQGKRKACLQYLYSLPHLFSLYLIISS